MEYSIHVLLALYATYEVRVTHMGGANKNMRMTDASSYVMTQAQAEAEVQRFQEKYSVPAMRTFGTIW
jgi:hypothetical protein